MKKSTKSIVFLLGITTAGFAIYALLEKPRREAPDLKNPTASAVEFSNSNQTDNRLLPPPDSKLRDIIPELKKRANSGDARASCRLAAEYELCRSTKNQVDSLELFIADEQKRETSEAKANANQTIVLLSKALIQDEQHCEAVEIPPAREIISLWRSAALKNHRPSMVTYALGQAFSLNNTMDELDSLLLYRVEAEQMANRAVAAGSAEAVLALARAYSPEGQAPMRSLLAQSVGPDSVKAMSLYLLLRNSSGATETQEDRVILDSKLEALQGLMTAAEVASAELAAGELGANWSPAEGTRAATFARFPGTQAGKRVPADCDSF